MSRHHQSASDRPRSRRTSRRFHPDAQPLEARHLLSTVSSVDDFVMDSGGGGFGGADFGEGDLGGADFGGADFGGGDSGAGGSEGGDSGGADSGGDSAGGDSGGDARTDFGLADAGFTFDQRPHDYDLFHVICDQATDPYCSTESVMDSLRRNPAPFASHEQPVNTGDQSNVPLLGTVVHEYDPSEGRVTNRTVEGHLLDPGQVDRYVEQYGTQIGVRTHGTGTGSFATLNEGLSPLVWGLNALEIRSDYVQHRGLDPI